MGSPVDIRRTATTGWGTLIGTTGRAGTLRGAATFRQVGSRPYSVTRCDASYHAPEKPVGSGFTEEDEPRIKQMRVEAVLLLAKSPLTTRKLAQLAYLADATEARTLVRQLNRTYETHGRALRVEQVAGGYRLMTRSALAPWLAKLGHLPEAVRLSTPMMETLAVVAYRQPVSRANVEAVRGVACGELLRQLMERELIRIAGRSEELGRPYLYGTTKRFLQLFGLPNTDALPPIQWHALQDDPEQDNDGSQRTSLESTTDEMSMSPKESVVSTAVASVLAEADPEVLADPAASDELVSQSATLAPDQTARAAIGDDEEEEDWDDDDEIEDDDDLDDDWDDEEDEDDDVEDDDVEDDDLEELDDEDEWQEVDDDDDDDEDDEDDDWDDDDEEDDEEWEDDDDEEWD